MDGPRGWPQVPIRLREVAVHLVNLPLPAEGCELESLERDCREVIRHSRQNGHPRMFGYIAFVAYMAQIVVSCMAGRWLLQRTQPAWAERPIIPLVVGLILYVILTAIPWLGGFVGLLVALLGMGALWDWGRATFFHTRSTTTRMSGLQPA